MASIQVRSSSVAVLEGGCECGRNQYVIYVPASSGRDENSPKVLFDVDSWSCEFVRRYNDVLSFLLLAVTHKFIPVV